MVKNGQQSIRPVHFTPIPGADPNTEVATLAWIRRRGGAAEFTSPQRLGFDLLLRIESGATTHTVDFTEYSLAAGDVLWVRAGQVQQWGRIDDIEGGVVMFTPHSLEPRTVELLRADDRNHWPGAAAPGSPLSRAFGHLAETDADTRELPLRAEIVGHVLAAVLLRLVASAETTSASTQDDVYRWFRDEVEQRFTELHKVSEYAARLGYSARTVNRAAQARTGLTAKQLIDQRVLLEAKRLLAHDDDPVAEIAAQLGFADAANFSKYFRHLAGVTPAVFRRDVRTQPGG